MTNSELQSLGTQDALCYTDISTMLSQLQVLHEKLHIVNPRKLEHRSRTIHAGIPYTLL